MHDLTSNYKALSLIRPKSITATETGTGVTIESYEEDAMAIVNYGALGGTTETFITTIQTSVIGDFTDAVTALTFGTVTGTNGDNTIAAGTLKLTPGITKVRAVVTMSGSSASLVTVMILVKSSTGGSTVNSTTPA